MKRNLTQFLVDSNKLASKLDWKKASGAILALDVGHDKIGLAIAPHPAYGDSALKLEPVPLLLETRNRSKTALAQPVIEELQKIVRTYNICGFLVSWPLQKEGRAGAPCGKTLHTLDSLIEESSSVVTQSRPFCLWDEHHYVPTEDKWGRTGQYSHITKKTVHYASEEQYAHECNSSVAVDVWNDYCSKHWPELMEAAQYCEDDPHIEASVLSSCEFSNSASSGDANWSDDQEYVSYTDDVVVAAAR